MVGRGAGHARLAAVGDAPEAPPAVAYARYLETLSTRPHHGERAFPRRAVTSLVEAVLAGEGASAGDDRGPVPDGASLVARATVAAALSLGAVALAPALRRDLAWAALLLPVGAMLGPALLDVLGGTALWQGASPALRVAAFGARLDGVPVRARSILLRLGGEGGRDDPTTRRLLRPTLALAQGASMAGLSALVAADALRPDAGVARALALRYGERVRARAAAALAPPGGG